MHYNIDQLYKYLKKVNASKKNVLMRDLLSLNAEEVNNVFVIRCDIERDLKHTLKYAQKLNKLGLKATMYFHSRTYTYNPEVFRKIENFGHEIGYHHECLDRVKGDFKKANELFKSESLIFRNDGFNLDTVCAHGEPGLKKEGYKFNYDLLRRYPDLLEECNIKAEVYTTIKDTWAAHYHYASDVFSKYDQFWKVIDGSIEDDKPLQLLIHPHRWSSNPIKSYFEVFLDLFQMIKNRLFSYRKYKAIQ